MNSEIYEKNLPIIEELYRKKTGYYIKVAYNICKDMNIAREVVSDAFYKILNYDKLLKPAYESHSLMILVVKQQLFNKFKRNSIKKKIMELIDYELVTEPNLGKISLYPTSSVIQKRVEKLSERDKIIIKSRYYKEMSLKDMADIYKMNLKQIPTVCQRILNRLKRKDPTENRRGWNQKANRETARKPPAFAFEIIKMRTLGLTYTEIGKALEMNAKKVKNTYNHYERKIKNGIIDKETLLTIKN